MSKNGGRDTPGTPGSRPCHTKGLDCLGISPPSLKGRESKEAHEPGQVQDLKPKTTKKKLKKIQKMISETSQNGSQNLSKFPLGGLLGRSWGLLGGSWALLEHILKKTLKKPPPLEANLVAKINEKSKKIDVKKAFVLR